MNASLFQITQLTKEHDRATFHSGSTQLDQYLQKQVTQDIQRRVTACFVSVTDDTRIIGYYTLSSASILLNDLPNTISKKLPRYPTIPVVRMGRLAVDQSFQGQGWGSALLADGISRILRSEIAAYAITVDAKDETAKNFYQHHGFIPLQNLPFTLFLPLATVQKLVEYR